MKHATVTYTGHNYVVVLFQDGHVVTSRAYGEWFGASLALYQWVRE